MRLQLLTLCILFVMLSQAFATAQMSDMIEFEGKEYDLYTNPLNDYFQKYPDKKPEITIMSTALWRGYIATFSFSNDSLFLKDIVIMQDIETEDGSSGSMWKSVLKEVVAPKEKLHIDWYTGLLVLPYGELVEYVHMGYASTFSNYILLEITNGILTGQRKYDHKEYETFKDKQFQAYKQTDDYQKKREQLINDGSSEESSEQFLKEFVISYTSKFLTKE